MKKILKSKANVIILSCLVLLGVFAAVTMATDTNTVNIVSVNVVHDEQVKLAYRLEVEGLGEGEELVMRFWGAHPTDADSDGIYDVTDKTLTGDPEAEGGGIYFAKSKGFAPYEMTQQVFAQAVMLDKNGNEIAHSKLVRYSVFEYICAVNYDKSSSEDDLALYGALLDYVTYAQKYLGWTENSSPESLGYITVTNGYILPAVEGQTVYTHGVFLADKSITIRGDMAEEDFAYWYRGDNGSFNIFDKPWSYRLGVAAQKHRNYVAVERSSVSVSVTNGVGAATEGNVTVTFKNTPTGESIAPIVDGDAYDVNTRYIELTANTVGGMEFIGWFIGDTLLTDEATLLFNPHVDENGVELGGHTHSLVAKYDAPNYTRWQNLKTELIADLGEAEAALLLSDLQTLNAFYDGSAICAWLATLWEPYNCYCGKCDPSVNNIACYGGGFYYSTSSMKYAGFYPDLESTYQAINWLAANGAMTGEQAPSGATEPVKNAFFDDLTKARIVAFAKATQSTQDGYFFHPQWPQTRNELQNDRYGRDLSWATTLIRELKPYGVHQYPNYCAPAGAKCETHNKNGGSCSFPISEARNITASVAAAGGFTSPLAAATDVVSAVSKVRQCSKVVATAAGTVEAFPDYDTADEFVQSLYNYNEVSKTNKTELLKNSGKAHNINANKDAIFAQGYSAEMVTFLNDMQARAWNAAGDKPTGVWQNNINKHLLWGVLKYMPFYNYDCDANNDGACDNPDTCIYKLGNNDGIAISGNVGVTVGGKDVYVAANGDKSLVIALTMINACLDAIKLGTDDGIDWRLNDMMNQWSSITSIMINVGMHHGDDGMKLAYELVRERTAEPVTKTAGATEYALSEDGTFTSLIDLCRARIQKYKINDAGSEKGLFVYSESGRAPTSIYGTYISLGLREGDVNGNGLVCSMYRSIFTALGYTAVPLCSKEDGKKFLTAIKSASSPLANKNSVPVSVSFEGITDGTLPDRISSHSNISTTEPQFELGIETSGSNSYLHFHSENGANHNVTFNTTSTYSEGGEGDLCYVFEADIAIGASAVMNTKDKTKEYIQVAIGDIYMMGIGYDYTTGELIFAYRPHTSIVGDAVATVKVAQKKFVALRMELYIVGGKLYVQYYVNGSYVATDKEHHFRSQVSTAEQNKGTTVYATPHTNFDSVKFTSRANFDINLYLDNCYFNKINKDYVAKD